MQKQISIDMLLLNTFLHPFNTVNIYGLHSPIYRFFCITCLKKFLKKMQLGKLKYIDGMLLRLLLAGICKAAILERHLFFHWH